MNITAIWLRLEGGESGPQHVVVLAEIDGRFVEVIRELNGGHFSHIVERAGMARAARESNDGGGNG